MNMSNEDDAALARRAAVVEAEAKAAYGEENWAAAMRSLTRQVAEGRLEGADIAKKMCKPTAVADLFYQAAGEMSDADWRAWRDSQPKRAERIERAKR
jgi:hypothetical protein